MLWWFCACLAMLSAATTASAEILVAVSYGGPAARPPATILNDVAAVSRDLMAVRRAGFNAISTWISWQAVQRTDGPVDLAAHEQLVALATENGLRVLVRVLYEPAPDWAKSHPLARGRFTEAVRAKLTRAGGIVVEEANSPAMTSISVAGGTPGLAAARLEFWQAIAGGAERITFSSARGGVTPELVALGETAGVVTRNLALFEPLKPRTGGVRQVTAGGGAAIEVRLLESPQALMILAFNRSVEPRKARIAFTPEIPEAIWQDLERGAAVNFVMERGGPVLEHAFAARDVVVLMIRKTLR